MKQSTFIISAVVMSLSILGAGYFLGNGLVNFNTSKGQVTVKGLAERDVEADTGVWCISHNAKRDTLEEARALLKKNQQIIESFLKDSGFDVEEFSRKDVKLYTNRELEKESGDEREYKEFYEIDQTITVRSTKVHVIDKAAQNTFSLIENGVFLGSSQPVYMYTKLNDIKPDMITEATRNARDAAIRFADDSKSKVGKILNADQGWFHIQSAYGDEVENEQYSIDKKVRVITSVNFSLVD